MRKGMVVFLMAIIGLIFYAGSCEMQLPANLTYTAEVELGDFKSADLPSGVYFDEYGQAVGISVLADSIEDKLDFYFNTDEGVSYFISANNYNNCTHVTGFLPLESDTVNVFPTAGYADRIPVSEDGYIAVQLQNNHYVKLHITEFTPATDSTPATVKFEAWYNDDEGWTNFEYAPMTNE